MESDASSAGIHWVSMGRWGVWGFVAQVVACMRSNDDMPRGGGGGEVKDG